VIDTGGRMMKVDIESATYEVLVPSGLPLYAQDCVYDPLNNRIIVAAFVQSAAIVSVDPESGEITTLLDTSPGRYDGVTIDQNGNFYFASYVSGGRVYRYDNDFSGAYEIVASGLGQPTGLYFNQQDNILAVPSFNHNEVYYFNITNVGIQDQGSGYKFDFDISPNPAKDKAKIRLCGLEGHQEFILSIHDRIGKLVTSSPLQIKGSAELVLDVQDLSPGTYIVTLLGQEATYSKKIIIN
jgi:hypothetical protein